MKIQMRNHLLLTLLLFFIFSCGDSQSLSIPEQEVVISNNSIPQLEENTEFRAVINGMLDSSEVLYNSAKYSDALDITQKALSISLEKIGNQDTLTAKVYNFLSSMHWRARDLENALYAAERAMETSEQVLGQNNTHYAAGLRNMATVFFIKGNFKKALEDYQKVLEILILTLGEDNSKTAGIYVNIGLTLDNMGNLQEALLAYQKALVLYSKNYGDNRLSVAGAYHNIGLVLEGLGDLDKSIHYYENALSIYLNTLKAKHPSIATTYGALGIVWRKKKKLNKAFSYQQKALNIFLETLDENHPKVAGTYGNIGLVLKDKRDLKKSLEYYEKALKIFSKVLGKNHPRVAACHNNISNILVSNKNWTKALKSLEESLKIHLEIFGEKHPRVAANYINIGIYWLEKGNLERAFNSLQKANTILNYNFNNPTEFKNVSSLIELKRSLIKIKEYYSKKLQRNRNPLYLDSLRTHYQIMIALEDYLQKEFTASSTREFYAAQSIPVYEGAIANLLERNKTNELPETFLLAEKTKSRQLAEKIKAVPHVSAFGIPDSLRELEYNLEIDIAYFEKKKFEEEYEASSPNDSLLSSYQSKVFNLRNQRDSLLMTFKNVYPSYYYLRYSQQVMSINGIQDSLLKNDNQALVEYFVGDSSIFTFTILPDTFYIQDIKIDFPLEKLVRDMRCGIFSGFVQDSTLCGNLDTASAQDLYMVAAHQLYQKIFAPVDALIPDHAQITIIPDGVLGYLAFDALLTKMPREGQNAATYSYLLRDHTLSYAYSATLQKEMEYKQHKNKPKKNLLAMAPSFSLKTDVTTDTSFSPIRFLDMTKQRNSLSPLHFNIPEAEALVNLVGGKVLTGPKATEAAFIQEASKYRLLHLSTHGKANDELGDYSFLAFHNLEDSLENEWLYNRELYNLNLNADMVVLSACETGIGELQRGEGIISLARGFSYAGAKSIVTSLWSVNDQSTKVLMESFYQNLKEGMPKDRALRRAKLDYLNNYPNLGQEPFFWAAFIPIGDMSPLELDNENTSWLLFVAFGLLAFGFFALRWFKR